MSEMAPRKSRLGASLIEIVVSIAVFSLVLVSLAKIMNAGYEQYWIASGSLEVQKAALTGTQLMVAELTQSNMDSVEIVDPLPRPDKTVPAFDDIVFALPDDLNGERHYSNRGVVEWWSFVSYYTQEVNGVRSLLRSSMASPSPTTEVPVPSVLGITSATVQASAAPRMIMTGVGNFDLEQREDLVRIELTGIFQQRGTFSITIRNQAFPKN